MESPDKTIAGLLNTMNRGQYLLLVKAMRQLDGPLRIDASDLAAWETAELPVMSVDATDGPVILTLM